MDISEINPDHPIQVEFGPDNMNWQNVREGNVHFIQLMESLLNDKLQAVGYLFVNDVLNRLGCPLTPEGQLLGWWANDGDHVTLEIDPDSPDDLIVINLQPAWFVWDKL